jgi:hypothetical protein
MFISVVQGRKIEFINISHVVRIEIHHPIEGESAGGTLHLQDGTDRQLGESEINWVMRMLQDLLGSPATGTKDATPGYWQGGQAEGDDNYEFDSDQY